MTRKTTTTSIASLAALALVAVLAAGCGGSGNGNASAAPPKTANGKPATVGVTNSGLGNILVNSQGRTLYMFQKDMGTRSECTGACTANWPPLRANGKPTVGSGLKASSIGTTMRSDGKPQVTYNGHPLYLFIGDHKPGDTNGEGVNAFGASWFALSSAGNQISAPSSSGGGNGY
jgi:predicted lipoprotein with Yx(FWY)xxD motif